MIPKGISYDKHSNKYKAYVDMGGYKIWLGSFQSEQEAMRVAEIQRRKFRTEDDFYDFSLFFSDTQLFYLLGKYYIFSYQDCSFRRFLFQICSEHFKLDILKSLRTQPFPRINIDNKDSKIDTKKVISLLLNANDQTRIASKLHLSRRHLQDIYSQLRDQAISFANQSDKFFYEV